MVFIPSKVVDRKTLIEAVRAAARAAGKQTLRLHEFAASSGIRKQDILNLFPKWNDLLREAGLRCGWSTAKIDHELLLADWGGAVRKLGRIPSGSEYSRHGQYCAATLKRSFGGCRKIPALFHEFAAQKPEWADVVALLQQPEWLAGTPKRPGPPSHNPRRPAARIPGRAACGAPLNFGPMRHAPVNEEGVKFLFALLAERLDFTIESLQAAFPDCEAKRRIGTDLWQYVTIEFEYESSNYRDHCHPAQGCDIIVCWRHDWKECPKNIEVIALEEEVQRMTAAL